MNNLNVNISKINYLIFNKKNEDGDICLQFFFILCINRIYTYVIIKEYKKEIMYYISHKKIQIFDQVIPQ